MTASNQTARSRPSATAAGDRVFEVADTVTTPGIEQTIIAYTVPAGFSVNFLRVDIATQFEGDWIIYHEADIVGAGRTGPARPSPSGIEWVPYESVVAGDTFEVKFTQDSYRPATEIKAFLQGRKLPV